MADTIASTNMNLPIPVVTVDPGPQWALDVNSCLTLIDAHDHSAGSGVPITPSGLNISADLSFLNNNAIALRSVRMTSESVVLSELTDLDCLYVVSGDLYYNDGLGNNVRITQSGGVAGSPGSIANLTSPASASYVALSSTFVWQSAANTPANMDGAAYIFRNLSASSKGLTLQPPAAMGADYTLTLPSLPASQKIMSLDNSGVMSAPYTVDNSTIEIATNVIGVKALGITAAQLASNSVTTAKILDANVTRPKLIAVGQQVSSGCGAFSTSSSSATDITNLTITITTTGRPVMLFLQNTSGSIGNIKTISSGGQACLGQILIARSGTSSGTALSVRMGNDVGAITTTSTYAPGSVMCLDVVGAGTYTYKAQAAIITGDSIQVNECILVAYEL